MKFSALRTSLATRRGHACLGAFAVALAALAWPSSAVAQAHPDPTARMATTALEGWSIEVGPRVGYFLPQRAEGGVVPRRPTAGLEIVARNRGSWYGARALFERSASWSPENDLGTRVLSGQSPTAIDSDEREFFETVVLDFVAFAPGVDGVRPYFFTGYGSKVIAAPEDAAILPYSLSAVERAPAVHGGVGIEAPLGGGSVVFEVGDYYGRNGGPDRVHDLHITMMARLGGIGDAIRTLVTGEDSDDR